MTPSEIGFFQCTRCFRCTWNANDIRYGYCGYCKLCTADTQPSMWPGSFPPIWTIHERPTDHPEHYVIRVSWGPWHEKRIQLAGTLELARMAVQMEGACVNLGRMPQDAPHIAESWI